MKEQPSFSDANITKQTIKTDEESKTSIIVKKHNKCSNKKNIIFGIIISLLVIIIISISILLVIYIKKYNDLKDKEQIHLDPNPKNSSSSSPHSSSSSPFSSSSSFPSSSSASPSSSKSSFPSSSSSSYPTTSFEEEQPIVSYEEAEQLLDSKIIHENHKILNESYNSLSQSFEIFNDTLKNLKTITKNVSYSIPEFLYNDTNSSFKIIRDDINLYNSKYDELKENANDLTEMVSESIKNLSTPMDKLKEDVNKMIEDFENKTKSFSLPLALENNSLINSNENSTLRRLVLKEKVQKYKDEVENLNKLYNNFFKYINQVTEVISENMILIPDSVKDINNNLENSILEYSNLLGNFKEDDRTKENHENLLDIKKSFLDIKENMNEKKEIVEERINFLKDLYKNNTFNLDNFQKESDTITDNINIISDSIINDINEERKNSGLNSIKFMKPISNSASSIIADSIIKSIHSSFRILINIEIIKQNKIISIIILINVEERTSLDLLFIMDITGSMSAYVEQAKKNIINIINKIVDDCPGIDINMGFIGYRDKEEELTGNVVDIQFTKNHIELKNKIQSLVADGGGDTPEDVAWAFEKALNKTWKSNAKFIVYVADQPNHGKKYGSYSYTIPGRRDLEELIKEIADNGISLFCMEIIQSATKTMFNVFEKVYENYEKAQFQVIPMNSANSFSNVVVESAKNIYESQRMNDGSISFEYDKKKLRVFLIEINPILMSITNETLYKNNSGHPFVSEYFDQDRELALKEMKEDLEFASHGKIEVEFVNHIIDNNFPQYKDPFQLSNGKYEYRLDEETYISLSKDEKNPDKGDWYKMIYSTEYKIISNHSKFDYDNLVKQYDLDELRKKNFFDQVWILGIDPLCTDETMMIGSNPFWINGEPLLKDCKNFMVVAISISRRDSNLHALGHGFENLFSFAFTGEYSNYDKSYDDDTPEKYEKLNEWEKFSLINKNSKGENAGVGNIHFPFNGIDDYDYENTNKVMSYLEYWENYPNKTAEKKKYNCDAWMKFKGNEILLNYTNECKDPNRLYVRFWMYLLPHVEGYTKTGHLNDWWDYFTNCDYVTKIDIDNKIINGNIGVEVPLNYKVYYKSGSVETALYESDDDSVEIIGNCVAFKNGKLIGSKKGTCSLNIFRDGKSLNLSININ